MARSRSPWLLGLALVALLGVVTVVSSGRHLVATGGTSHHSASRHFLDYLFTIGALFTALGILVWIYLLFHGRDEVKAALGQRRQRAGLGVLAIPVVYVVAAWLLRHWHLHHRGAAGQTVPRPRLRGTGGSAIRKATLPAASSTPHVQWWLVATVVVLLLLVAVALAIYTSSRRRREQTEAARASAAVSAALDDSLEDLRGERDVRLAVIAAYARMEQALGLHGLPRRAAEAPLEYLGRVLEELHTSGSATRRLTDLFERAKFSRQELDPPLRDEAIASLVAVRDELRATA